MKIYTGVKNTFLVSNIQLIDNMEKAVLISQKTNINKIKKYDRIYIGSEFCQNLLPKISYLEQILKQLSDKEISLITPMVNEIGLLKIDQLLKFITKELKSFEIIINDFGVLNLVHRKYPSVVPVLGRIISQQVTTLYPDSSIRDANTLRVLCLKYNIDRIEIDTKGKNTSIEIPKSIDNLKVSLYYPYLLVTTTNRCIIPRLFDDSFDVNENFKCHQECLRIQKIISFKYPMIKEKIYIKGNTHFIKHKTLPKNLEKMNINRIVYTDIDD